MMPALRSTWFTALRSSEETGTYRSDQEAFDSLLDQLAEARSSVIVGSFECRLKHGAPNEASWQLLKSALVSARTQHPDLKVTVLYNRDPLGTIAALSRERLADDHLIDAFCVGEEPLPFYGRVIDRYLVEVNASGLICGEGKYTRMRDLFVGRSIHLQMEAIARRFAAQHTSPQHPVAQ